MNSTVTGTAPAPGRYAPAGVPRSSRPVRVIDHHTDSGFCSVCGAVWPCARARREQRLSTDPFAQA